MSDEFGPSYILKQLADDVREMRSSLVNVATKTEVAYLVAKIEDFVPRSELDKKFDERDQRHDRSLAAIMDAIKDSRSQTATKEELRNAVESIKDTRVAAATKEELKGLQEGFASLKERVEQGPIASWLIPTLGFVFSIVWSIGYAIYTHGSGKP